jgi:hypothetical protein
MQIGVTLVADSQPAQVCSQAKVRSTTQRCLPNPELVLGARLAITARLVDA